MLIRNLSIGSGCVYAAPNVCYSSQTLKEMEMREEIKIVDVAKAVATNTELFAIEIEKGMHREIASRIMSCIGLTYVAMDYFFVKCDELRKVIDRPLTGDFEAGDAEIQDIQIDVVPHAEMIGEPCDYSQPIETRRIKNKELASRIDSIIARAWGLRWDLEDFRDKHARTHFLWLQGALLGILTAKQENLNSLDVLNAKIDALNSLLNPTYSAISSAAKLLTPPKKVNASGASEFFVFIDDYFFALFKWCILSRCIGLEITGSPEAMSQEHVDLLMTDVEERVASKILELDSPNSVAEKMDEPDKAD